MERGRRGRKMKTPEGQRDGRDEAEQKRGEKGRKVEREYTYAESLQKMKAGFDFHLPCIYLE
jgi:hypothetical protein